MLHFAKSTQNKQLELIIVTTNGLMLRLSNIPVFEKQALLPERISTIDEEFKKSISREVLKLSTWELDVIRQGFVRCVNGEHNIYLVSPTKKSLTIFRRVGSVTQMVDYVSKLFENANLSRVIVAVSHLLAISEEGIIYLMDLGRLFALI